MATVVAQQQISVRSLPGRRHDHVFFSVMSVLLLVSVFIGFGPTYYLAGVFRASLPSLIIHFHGAAFSCWVLLLVVQTSLVAAHRVDIHRRLGFFGFCLASLMVILGALAATNMLARNVAPPGYDPKEFYIVPMGDVLIFAALIFFAFRARFNSAAHKRFILNRYRFSSHRRVHPFPPRFHVPQNCSRNAGVLRVPCFSCPVRPLVHAQTPSRYAPRQRVRDLHAVPALSICSHLRLGILCILGPAPREMICSGVKLFCNPNR